MNGELNADGFPVGEWGTVYQNPDAPPGFGGANDLDSFDVGEVDTKGSGGIIDQEGAYHLQITKAKWEDAPNSKSRREMSVVMTCLHSTPGQSPEGSVLYHKAELPCDADRVSNDGKEPLWNILLASLCRFAAGCGVFEVRAQDDGSERFIDPATGTTNLQLSTLPQRLLNRQVIGRPKRRNWKNSDGFSIEFGYGRGVSAINSPANINVPINEAVAAAAGYRKALPPQAAPAATAPAAAAAKPAAAKSTAKAAAAAAPNVPPARPVQQALPMQAPVSPVAAVAEADPYGDM